MGRSVRHRRAPYGPTAPSSVRHRPTKPSTHDPRLRKAPKVEGHKGAFFCHQYITNIPNHTVSSMIPFIPFLVVGSIYGRDMSTFGASAANSLSETRRPSAANKPCLELLSRTCRERQEELIFFYILYRLYRQSDQSLEFGDSVISESMLNMSRQCVGQRMH